ncbi:MAG: glycosyltransferase family 2 protein, partial [Armatimonadota bacterium]
HSDRTPQAPQSATLSVLIVAQDCAEAITATLASVAFADEIVVVDGGSTDATCEVARRMGARVVVNPWPGYGEQFRFATEQATGDWVFRVDTDEVVSPELRTQIEAMLLRPDAPEVAWWVSRPTVFLGRMLRHGGDYPAWTLRLWRRGGASFTTPLIDELLVPHDPDAKTARLAGHLYHHAWASLDDLVVKLVKASDLRARQAVEQGRLRRSPGLALALAFPRKFGEVYLYKQGWRDGLPGLIAATCKSFGVFLREARLCLHQVPPNDRMPGG